jgi:hypothetical protein
MAARAGNRMQARQTYRTINRMERRRSMMRGAMTPDPEPQQQYAEPAPAPSYAAPPQQAAPAAAPSYVEELNALSQLHDQGILSDEEFDIKKRQILGI